MHTSDRLVGQVPCPCANETQTDNTTNNREPETAENASSVIKKDISLGTVHTDTPFNISVPERNKHMELHQHTHQVHPWDYMSQCRAIRAGRVE